MGRVVVSPAKLRSFHGEPRESHSHVGKMVGNGPYLSCKDVMVSRIVRCGAFQGSDPVDNLWDLVVTDVVSGYGINGMTNITRTYPNIEVIAES